MTKINNAHLFKDSNMKESWETYPFDKDGFTVEFKDNKARVYPNDPFVRRPSFFSKLNPVGQIGEKRLYKFTVNGNKVFMSVEYRIQ